MSEEELEILCAYYRKLAIMARQENQLSLSHSIEEAIEVHKAKYRATKKT